MRRLTAAMFALSLTLVGCGGGDDDAGGSSSSASASASASSADTGTGSGDDGYGEGGGGTGTGGAAGTITISDFGYGDPLTVAPGALVTVVNEDAQAHSATADDRSFDTGLFGQGETMTFTAPSAAGTYNITCTAHTQMGGQMIVAA